MSSAASTDARDRRDLAIAWMNRGHASIRCGDRAGLLAALESYRTASTLLRPLLAAPDADPSWANSLGAALMNFGQLLHRLHGTQRATEALAAFAEAEQILAPLSPTAVPWAPRNLAGTRIDRANLLLDLDRPADSADSARRALALAQSAERRDPVDADLALKARRVLCDALGRLLVGAGDATDALASEASDLVDDALALVRHWREQQVEFRELALRFFCFGAQFYRIYQPHFLAEFLRENLPPGDSEFAWTAADTLRSALDDLAQSSAFFVAGDETSARRLQTSRELKRLLAEISAADPASSASV